MTHLRPIVAQISKIPLRNRLPNPPPGGPDDESGRLGDLEDRIERALDRGPVVVIHGAGSGPTTLAVRTLHARFPGRVERSVFVDVSALDDETAAEELVRVLARSVGATLGGATPDYDELVATAIDLAEQADFQMVVKVDAAASFVELLARYARRSRWLIATDRPLDDAFLDGQQVALGPVGEPAIEAPGSDEDEEETAVATVHELVTAERWDELVETFERHGPRWLSGLLARRMWRVVAGVTAPSFLGWKLRIAAQIGERVTLRKAPQDPAARYWYARMLTAAGEHERARDVAAALVEGEAHFVDARLLAAEIDLRIGRAERALQTLEALDPDARPVARAMLSACLAQLDRTEAATRLVDSFPGDVDDPSVGVWLARALMLASSPARTGDLLERLDARFGESALDLAHGRSLRMMRARLAIYRGAFSEATERLERLRPFADTNPTLRVSIGLASATVRLLTGDVEGLPAALGATWLAAARATLPDHFWIAETHFVQLENLLGHEVARPGPQPDPAPPSPRYDAFVQLYETEAQLRRGDEVPTPAENHQGDLPHAATMSRLRARIATVRGDAGEALARSEVICRQLLEAGYRESAARQLEAITDLRAVTGQAGESTALLLKLAEEMEADRFVGHARLHAAVQARRPEALESLTTMNRSPVAMRRARWMLGLDAQLDRVDRAVVDGWTRHGRPRCRAFDQRESGWGFDPARGLVWDDDRVVDLSGSPTQLAFLEVLSRRGAGGTGTDKETLIEEAWGIDEYHPLRHDNRLRQTVRKLRQAIEPDPAEPTRVLTTEDGYRLGPGFRLAPG